MWFGPLLVSLLLPLDGSANEPGATAQTPVPAKTPAASQRAGSSRNQRTKDERAPRAPSAPAARIRAPKGFRVELLYPVPRDTQGSWVNMTVDPKGRLIVSDQYGKLYRVTLPPIARQGRGPARRADRRRRSARPTGCSGRSTASTWSSTAAVGMTAGSTASATPTATTGSTRSSCSARSTAAASTGRTR